MLRHNKLGLCLEKSVNEKPNNLSCLIFLMVNFIAYQQLVYNE